MTEEFVPMIAMTATMALSAPIVHRQMPTLSYNFGYAAALVAFLLAGVFALILIVRKFLRDSPGAKQDWSQPDTRTRKIHRHLWPLRCRA